MMNNKAIVLYPYREDDIKDTSNTSTAIVNQLREMGYEIKTIVDKVIEFYLSVARSKNCEF